MCGITGFVDFNRKLESTDVNSMTQVLTHRGPDFGDSEFIRNKEYHLAFGHRRLAIIDINECSNQPLFFDSKRYWIVYNGEVYNFKEIRDLLTDLGHVFETDSDTEVVLRSYVQWGCDAVNRFIGMFAFSIFDKQKQKIIIFRDRAGIKPLYFYFKSGTFLFSSELKSFHTIDNFNKEIDNNSVSMFFRHGYIHSPNSIYKNVNKILPGHYIEVCLKHKTLNINKYWDVIDSYNEEKLDISFNEAKEELHSLLKSAFNYRMVSDVPVGVFLSGGYDSSTTAAILASTNSEQINTFTIGFNGTEFDESKYAEKIASHLRTNHTTLNFEENHLEEIVTNLPYYYDEPFGDSSAIPTTLVSKIAKEHVKVVLSADGGDELLAGYPKHYTWINLYKIISRLPYPIRKPLTLLEKHKRFRHRKGLFSSNAIDDLLKVRLESVIFSEEEIGKMMTSKYTFHKTPFDDFDKLNKNNDFLNKLLAIDYKTYLENDILTKVDRATMSQSIEGREPFMDHRILEFCAKLDSSFKYSKGKSKFILREINKEYIPQDLLAPEKMGFSGPVEMWLKKYLKKELIRLVESSNFPEHIINKNYIENYVKCFLEGKEIMWNDWYKTYQIYTFLRWHEFWCE